MKIKQLLTTRKLSQKDKKWKHRDIFRILRTNEIWIIAYETIKSNQDTITPGVTSETLDERAMERLKRLQEKVWSGTYEFKPIKLTLTQRPNGRQRPLGFPTDNDKIVQAVLRIILDAIYEPVFVEESFGWRPGLGCHDALNHVEKRFRWVDYVIQAGIEQTYPTINHRTLMNILRKRIDDRRFLNLVWKLLKCGVFTEEHTQWLKKGAPQGSIVSSILANIYYHELDEFVKLLKDKYETPRSSQNNHKSPAYKALESKISQISKTAKQHEPSSLEHQQLAKELKTLQTERLKTAGLKDKKIRLEYVRYGDDWMIGVAGDKKLARTIQEEIRDFTKKILAKKVFPQKTTIMDIRRGNTTFLGYEIFFPKNRFISIDKRKEVKTIQRGQPELRFDIPVAEVTKRYVKRGYLKPLSKGVRPISKASYSVLEDHVIVSYYRSVWLDLKNYYSGCTNRGRLQYFHYLLHMSCAMTLAHRHRTSSTKIFKKHKKTLTVQIPDTNKTVSFPYKTTWRKSERKWFCGKNITVPTR
jgi:RNA-directed DNA polymerase